MTTKPDTDVKPPKVVPRVTIQGASGLVVQSNLDGFQKELESYLDTVPLEPTTDDDYAQAESAVKVLKKAEKALAEAEEAILASFPDVQKARDQVEELRSKASTPRLSLEKSLKGAKEQRKKGVIDDARGFWESDLKNLEDRHGISLPVEAPDFTKAVKGKRTLKSCREACDAAAVSALGAAKELAKVYTTNRAILDRLAGDRADTVVPDMESVGFKDAGDFAALVSSRLAMAETPVEAPRSATTPWPEAKEQLDPEVVRSADEEFRTEYQLEIPYEAEAPEPDWGNTVPLEEGQEPPPWLGGANQAYVPPEEYAEWARMDLPPPRSVSEAVSILATAFGDGELDIVQWLQSDEFAMDLIELEGQLHG